MSALRPIGLLLAAAVGVPAQAAETVALPLNGSVPLNMAPTSFTNDLYIDIPADVERLNVRLLAANASKDVDLLLRFDEAFPDSTIDRLPPDASWLAEQSHYAALSPFGDEMITISRASHQPLRAARLHVSVINYEAENVTATVSAQSAAADQFASFNVLFDNPGTAEDPCNIAPWNDNTPATPVRGNSGTTLGQQRRNALNEAARLLAEELRPNTTVNIQACWDTLESASTLAQAGPEGFWVSDVFGSNNSILRGTERYLEKPYTIYAQAAVAHQAGTRSCSFAGGACNQPDLRIEYNLTVDQNANPSRRFDYGFSAEGTVGSSFVTVSLHEIAHGLGFLGLINLRESNGPIGSRLTEYDDVYGSWARIGPPFPAERRFLRATDGDRATALIGTDQLRFAGPNALVAPNNAFRAFTPPTQFVPLFTTSEIQPGSTYSHLSNSSGGQLMLPTISGDFRTLDLSKDMLRDLGWVAGQKSVPDTILPPDAQFFDVTHDGHGFDIRRIDGTEDLYFMVFYSFDANGNPEWFNAIGRVKDGLFMPERNAVGDSLANNLFLAGQTPQTIVDPSPTFRGQVRIDYKSAEAAPSCQVSAPGRPTEDPSLGAMTWALGDVTETWCVQPIVVNSAALQTDISGIWFNPADPGWGITFVSFPGAAGDGLAAQIYYPDATGAGRWALVFVDSHVPGSTYPVFHPANGYCRTCPAQALNFNQQIGTMTVNVGGSGSPTVSFDITYPGVQGGRFTRTNAPIVTGSTRRF